MLNVELVEVTVNVLDNVNHRTCQTTLAHTVQHTHPVREASSEG